MSPKKWVISFLCCLAALPLLLAGFNFVVDPFGVFGNCTWYSFSETLNPRVAKISYLKEHFDQYDSYLVGCSSTSSFPVEDLNQYLDASFYNTIVYGADMSDSEKIVQYLLANDEVKNIVLNVYIDNGMVYGTGEDELTMKLPAEVSGAPALPYYLSYLFADPNYAFDKIEAAMEDSFLTKPFDVFNEETGAYDKRVRDIEHIGDMERYLEAYPEFVTYPHVPQTMEQIDACMESIQRIKEMCKAAGTTLYVVCAPVYSDYLANFTAEDIGAFYTALAQVTPYWDFSYSSVSEEPRYFYDATHFRNAVGTMALGRMFGNDTIYIPEDFGVYVTEQTVGEHIKTLTNRLEREDEAYTQKVPILMYHHLSQETGSGTTISAAAFEDQIAALQANGYTAVTLEDLYDYVTYGTELPDKPIVITFDDGYESNYTLAYPILERYGFCGTIFTIGVSVGKDTYKDTGAAIIPHFDWEQAREMVASGVIEIGSHTYDFHQSEALDPAPVRSGVLQLPGESEEDYITAFRGDISRSLAEIEAGLGEPVHILAYPFGFYTELSQVLCREQGIYATLTVEERVNTLVKGLPQCLYGLGRFNVTESSGQELIARLEA